MSDNEPLKVMCPTWVRGEMDKLINELDGSECDVMVGAVAILGENGYDFDCREQSTNFDPKVYGPVMLQGYNMIAGCVLAKVLDHLHEALQSELHFTQEIEDDAERFQQTRNIYEHTIRDFLKQLFTYAGFQFQTKIASKPASATKKSANISLACGSNMIAMWRKVAETPMVFKRAGDQDEQGNQDSECGQDSGPADL